MLRFPRLGDARALGLGAALLLACSSSMPEPTPEPPFEPFAPEAYTAKVKNLLTGQALTEAELQAVQADPNKLPELIDTWLNTPEAEAKLLAFFQQAFQQTQITISNFSDQLPSGFGFNAATQNLFIKSARESFARTALQLMKEGRPWTETVTSNRYVLNAPLMAYMAFADTWTFNDKGQRTNRLAPSAAFTASFGSSVAATSYVDSVNPGSANYLKFKTPGTTNTAGAGCMADPYVPTGQTAVSLIYDYMHGRLRNCNPTVANGIVSQWTQADWDNWKVVTIRRPMGTEQPTAFFDIPKLRTATELVVNTPRVGFMTTPAFFANWPTNPSNQHRVTINQTTIVALNKSFDDTINNNIPSIDTDTDPVDHVKPGTVCFSCHLSLDPMRQLFRQTYSFYGSEQTDAAQKTLAGAFAFDDEVAMNLTGGISDLAANLAKHHRLPIAWTQKLCYYANSTACNEEDPEFLRVVDVFKASNFNFRTLLRELFSSPLVTLATRTKTFTESEAPVTIQRQEHFCSAISSRLGINDVCAMNTISGLTALQTAVSSLSLSIPAASYSRGAESPVVSRDPNLFFRASVENICRRVADEVVDKTPGTPRYTSAMPQPAIDDFVKTVMGIPVADARHAAARSILAEHFDAASKTAGIMARDALKSTFVLACSSPTSVSSGL
ncbi:MAG: hypothetical protein JNJ46_04490 [Myxococcales bacterium]|nr:hypothetical protein [Myxococcales bacterium]